MSLIHVNDRVRCEEMACRPGSVFELVHRFMAGPDADSVLAMEAFFRSISEIPERITDPAIATAKLSWWVREMDGLGQSGSQHPVLRALLDTGAVESLETAGLEAYLGAHYGVVHDGPCERAADFEKRLAATGGREALIWMELKDTDPAAEGIERIGVASRLLNHVETLAETGNGGRWLPLEWQPVQNLPELLVRLAGRAMEHLRMAETQLRDVPLDHETTRGGRYLFVRTAVERRRLARVLAHPEQLLRRGGGVGGITDALTAWRQARRMAKTGR